MKLREYLENNKETAQIIYGAVLIILIPLLIVFNTVFIIKRYNQSLDLALQGQALAVGRVISVLMENDFPWVEFIQLKIDALMTAQIGIKEICVFEPEDSVFKIVASSRREKVGATVNSAYYQQAWSQIGNSGLATDSLKLTDVLNGPDGLRAAGSAGEDDSRFWLIAIPMQDASGKKQALLTVKLSSQIVDDATRENRNLSIFILIGTVFIVILFLMAAVRFWDYLFLYQRAKAIDRMKDDFIAMASHELRSPVAAIRGYIAMMLDGTMGQVSQKIKDSLKTAAGAADRLTALVEDLLDVSRIEQERIKMNTSPQPAIPLIESVIEEMRGQAQAKKLALNFTPFFPSDDLIAVDAVYFKQIMVNLLTNALKYTREGSVEVNTEEKNHGQVFEIRVKDTGIGMTDGEKARLFEKFYRAKNEMTRGIAGTGLGLWITKQLVEIMKGSIAVESIEGVGTQVSLRFPIVKRSE
ncbi:MAG: HAMP domain-containing histidine kinase [Planctomycetes bacterium]|jgi:signal transduction histidine kinase|nr:HAMP domain-containing histidine kinase [Planctomycetota bacterium]